MFKGENLNSRNLNKETDYKVMVAAAAAKSLQSCPTLCDPTDPTAHQAPLSLGFSRQKHWSGVPLPSAVMVATSTHKK